MDPVNVADMNEPKQKLTISKKARKIVAETRSKYFQELVALITSHIEETSKLARYYSKDPLIISKPIDMELPLFERSIKSLCEWLENEQEVCVTNCEHKLVTSSPIAYYVELKFDW